MMVLHVCHVWRVLIAQQAPLCVQRVLQVLLRQMKLRLVVFAPRESIQVTGNRVISVPLGVIVLRMGVSHVPVAKEGGFRTQERQVVALANIGQSY